METTKVKLEIDGMSCSSCVAKVENILKDKEGVQKVDVSLLTKSAMVEVESHHKDHFVASLAKEERYRMHEHHEGHMHSSSDAKLKKQKQRLILSALLTLPLVLPMLVGYLGWNLTVNPWIQWALASVIQFYIAQPFYKSFWLAVKRKSADMDTLVVLGTTAAYVMSTYYFFTHQAGHHNYFETAATIITFILMGRYLEEKAKKQTLTALKDLHSLMPSQATVKTERGLKSMDIRFLKVGDHIVVKAGERIPSDGRVLSGISHVDEAFLTGESRQVEKLEGADVSAGSLNLDGELTIEVLKLQSQSLLAEVISFVENAQSGKAPIQRLADKVSAYFVPTVMLIALGTLLVSYFITADFQHALWSAVAVLVIACPCALGLATPAALMVGMGEAARSGFLIRGPESLERLHFTDAIIFDKTGTLTLGKPKLAEITADQAGQEHDRVLVAAALQRGSHHPLANALHEYLGDEVFSGEVQNLRTHAGLGVEGVVAGRRYVLGSVRFMGELGIDTQPFAAAMGKAQQSGNSYSFLADVEAKKALGLFEFADTLREQSQPLIAALKERHIQSYILSGDAEAAVKTVAQKLGVAEYKAEAKPLEKVEFVKKAKTTHRSVAMVGDGINDAPALVTADLGISLGSGADVAQSSAQAIILDNNPLKILRLFEIAQRTYKKIWENLFFAFVFNVIGIPLAAMGKLTPEFAGLAMGLSSTIVLSNALLLKYRLRQRLNKEGV